MKLIIDIPEGTYKAVELGTINQVLEYKVWNAIKNGIPLDDVKAEVHKAQEPYKTSTAYDEGVRFGLMLAYQIIHKYKAESEDK